MAIEVYRLMRHYFDMVYVFLSSFNIPGTSFSAFDFFVGILSCFFISLVFRLFIKKAT